MKNTENSQQKERLRAAIETVKSQLSKNDFPGNKRLVEICKDFGISLIDSGGNPHLLHEILETSVNLYLNEAEWLIQLETKNKYEILARLEDLTSKLPTQSWRGLEQIGLQQFSTSPALAYLLLLMLRPEAGKLSLEPSAGTGSLAVWLRKHGCQTEVNEISARRKLLLELQNFEFGILTGCSAFLVQSGVFLRISTILFFAAICRLPHLVLIDDSRTQ